MYFSVVHPDMAVYIRIVPILEKLRTVLMPQLPYIGHGSLKKIFSHKGFRFFLENLGQSTKALALYSPQFFQNWDKYLQYILCRVLHPRHCQFRLAVRFGVEIYVRNFQNKNLYRLTFALHNFMHASMPGEGGLVRT